MKKGVVVVSLISLLVMVAGCASYGKLRLQSGPGETMTTLAIERKLGKISYSCNRAPHGCSFSDNF
jgi:hypothetical protein